MWKKLTEAKEPKREVKYLEEPRNPGVDDGLCALCSKVLESPDSVEEEFRCHGCGYLVCSSCCISSPTGPHLVVEHQEDEEGDDDGEGW
jgi:hypothetical protein